MLLLFLVGWSQELSKLLCIFSQFVSSRHTITILLFLLPFLSLNSIYYTTLLCVEFSFPFISFSLLKLSKLWFHILLPFCLQTNLRNSSSLISCIYGHITKSYQLNRCFHQESSLHTKYRLGFLDHKQQ